MHVLFRGDRFEQSAIGNYYCFDSFLNWSLNHWGRLLPKVLLQIVLASVVSSKDVYFFGRVEMTSLPSAFVDRSMMLLKVTYFTLLCIYLVLWAVQERFETTNLLSVNLRSVTTCIGNFDISAKFLLRKVQHQRLFRVIFEKRLKCL